MPKKTHCLKILPRCTTSLLEATTLLQYYVRRAFFFNATQCCFCFCLIREQLE
jgi:hypothetical protein